VFSIRLNSLSFNLSHSFAETSPEASSGESEGNTSDEDEKPLLEPESSTRGREESQDGNGVTASASKLPTELPAKEEKPKSKDSKLVQATLSNLFKKAEEKTAGTSKAKSSSKA